jgi:hypothetical protein
MGGATAQKKMMRMDPITRQVPERSTQDIAMLGEVVSPVGMPSQIMTNSLFRPLGGPNPSISVTPPIPMRAAPMSVR